MDDYQQRMEATFREEAGELLVDLENGLLELEAAPEDTDCIDRVFRAMHTIKGSGSMFGFEAVAAFAHEVETVFDLVRNGELKVTKELIDRTLEARDHIRAMLDSPEEADKSAERRIITSMRALAPGTGGEEADSSSRPTSNDSPEGSMCYRIRFGPHKDIFLQGTDPLTLLHELEELGECVVVADTAAIPELDQIAPESCYTSWDIILTSSCGINAVRDVFIFVEDESDLRIEVLDEETDPALFSESKKLGEILIEKGDLDPDALEHVLTQKKLLGRMLVDAGVVDTPKVQSALAEQKQVRAVREKRLLEQSSSSIRVGSEKLDKLVDLVGELVTAQARLSQTASREESDADLAGIAEDVERLTAELRDNAMSLRMVPIGTTFARFNRLVRDLSHQLGKQIELTTDGAETELDKTVIEQLNDPLVHLIRNSIDHGIESDEERRAAGKPAEANINLSASHAGSDVLVKVSDDGKGLDAELIRAKAIERGLILADEELTEQEVFRLIFSPGFSTATEVTDVSGRGVGMDVVTSTIEALHGSVEIASKPGEGTTITLQLPLTLAIIEGLLVQISDEHFVVPLSSVEECLELTREDVAAAQGRSTVNVRGKMLPYINLRSTFEIPGETPPIEQIVITRTGAETVGFVVDQVVGQIQTVIKSLGKMYEQIKGVSGATIMGNGSVALVLDIARLRESAEAEGRWAASRPTQ
jgi:two-component system, chemotaxis family, sensor kinase CheA